MLELNKKIAAFKKTYPTLKDYFTKYASKQEKIDSNIDAWVNQTMANVGGDLYIKYKDLYYAALSADNNLQYQPVLSSMHSVQSSGNPFGMIYDNHAITDFNIVAWSKVFPELAQTFALDDTNEVILIGIDKTIDDVERQYAYLLFSMKLDNMSNSHLNDWFVKYKGLMNTINALKQQIAATRMSDSSDILFNSSHYDSNSVTSMGELNENVQNYIDTFNNGLGNDYIQWLKSYTTLKQYKLINNVGSLPMYSVHGGFNLSNADDKLVIPMVNHIDKITYNAKSYESQVNPIRTILHLISANLFNQKEVLAHYYNPGEIQNTSFEREPYDDASFTNLFNAKSNPENAISNMIPSNGNPYNIMGIVPILTSQSSVIDDGDSVKITNVVLVDSDGNIWNPNMLRSEGNLDKFVESTNKFSLNINKSTGVTIVNGAKLYEYHWAFGDQNFKRWDGMIILSTNKTIDECWNGDEIFGEDVLGYTPTCVKSTKESNIKMSQLQMWPSYSEFLGSYYQFARVVSPNSNFDVTTPYAQTKPIISSARNQEDVNRYIWYPMYDQEHNDNQFSDDFFRKQFLNDKEHKENSNYGYLTPTTCASCSNKYAVKGIERYDQVFSKYRDSNEHIPHGLRLIPMTPDLITKVAGKLDGNTKKVPLLPGYKF